MGKQKVMPPEELADQVRGPGYVCLDFGVEDEPIKYECLVLGPPGSEPEVCSSVWLTEEVGTPGEQDYRLKHFPPGRYTATFVESDDVTGRPIFERAYRFDAEGTNTTENPSGFGPSGTPVKLATKKNAAPKKAGPKSAAKKPAARKPAARKPAARKPAAKKPTKPAAAKKKANPSNTQKGGGRKGKSGK